MFKLLHNEAVNSLTVLEDGRFLLHLFDGARKIATEVEPDVFTFEDIQY